MRYEAISNRFFIKNRDKLTENLLPNSIAIIFGAHQMPRNGDQFFPYRQQSDFFYLTGIEQEKSILLLCNDNAAQEFQQVLFILKPNKNLEIWEGHKLSKPEATSISGIKTVRYLDEFETILHNLLCGQENVYFNFSELPKFSAEVNSRDHDFFLQFQKKYPLLQVQRLAPILQQMRLIKSATEIDLIRKACSITNNAFHRVLRLMQTGKFEYEVEAEINYEFTSSGCSGHAYPPIIAGGNNACILHYIENNQRLKNGELVLMDFGAEYANFAADLSRTIPVNGTYSKRQKDAYNATLRVFKFARNLMKPGTNIAKFHKEVCKKWEEEHLALGLYTSKDIEENQSENPLWYNYYMHGTGHFLGLDVHDVGTRETVFEPGMVLTCEPGLYIAKEGLGIRIENNILITENGNLDLMEDIPIEIEEIEDLMNA